MKPDKMIIHGNRHYSLAFMGAKKGDKFRSSDAFERDADVALIRSDSVNEKTEYLSSAEWKTLARRLQMVGDKLMSWISAFRIADMPEMSMVYVCEWQNLYWLVLFTDYKWPYVMNTKIRVKENETQEALIELAQDFLRESYGNDGIKLEPIYEEDLYEFEYGCPHCGWKGDIDDAKIIEVSEGADEPVCPDCDEPLMRMK